MLTLTRVDLRVREAQWKDGSTIEEQPQLATALCLLLLFLGVRGELARHGQSNEHKLPWEREEKNGGNGP